MMNPRPDRCFSRHRAGLALAALLSLGACGSAALNPEQRAYQERYARAKALFEQRCKTAGVVIHRTVKDVEGIELTKIRQPVPWGGKEYFDPMWPEAAMAGEIRGDDYIKQFLMYEYPSPQSGRRGELGPLTREKARAVPKPIKGYDFVEHVDPKDQQRYRCTPDWSLDHPNWVPGQHRCAPVTKPSSRYALDYEDLVDPGDRTHWIAGTKLKVIDRLSGEVIAQLTRFIWDPGFGASSTGRWPWSHAAHRASQYCPESVSSKRFVSRTFTEIVLIPKQGD